VDLWKGKLGILRVGLFIKTFCQGEDCDARGSTVNSDCPGRKIWTVEALLYETGGRRMTLDMLAINGQRGRSNYMTSRLRVEADTTRGGQRQEQTHNFKLVQTAHPTDLDLATVISYYGGKI